MTKDIDPDFDPAKHTLTESSYFEDLEIGQRFLSPSRTLGDANFAAFQMVSGDNHPIHYDEEYCRRRGYPGMLAHGLQVAAQCAPGAGMLPHVLEDSLIGLIEHSAKFLKPVYSGDTVYPALEVIDLTPRNTTGVITLRTTVHNQRRQLVLEGEQKMLVKKRSTAANK
jgi:acyl dehydratase|tara:strand:+ start:204 stop:707 length:504 start_codon:yes stop_codon:yes gene_type:complete